MSSPVSVAALKAHLRLDAGATGEDVQLQALIDAATATCLQRIGRPLSGETPDETALDADETAVLAQAVTLLAGDWYDCREAGGDPPNVVLWLIEPLKSLAR